MTWGCRAAWAVLAAGVLSIGLATWHKLPARSVAASPETEKVGRSVAEKSDVPAPYLTFFTLSR